MAEDAGDVAGGSGGDPSCSVHAKHIRYLFQDSYRSRHGSGHPSLRCSRQTPCPFRGYCLNL